MNIVVTGATGFIGKNLTEQLTQKSGIKILTYDPRTAQDHLSEIGKKCNFVFHLAAVHRPLNSSEFKQVNVLYFAELLEMLRTQNNTCPVLFTSSYQAIDQTPYGRSKLAAEEELKRHAKINHSRAIIYRLTNTFGQYARPNQHSVVATFCYNIACGLPIEIHDPNRLMHLYYIDDVINLFLSHLNGWIEPDADGFYRLPDSLKYEITLQALADKIYSFKADFEGGAGTAISDDLTVKLHKTFCSYMPGRGASS